jgi:hypothetical protein
MLSFRGSSLLSYVQFAVKELEFKLVNEIVAFVIALDSTSTNTLTSELFDT